MPQSGRTFRIFVSSTFSDLVAERNALQERVFPRLRELAVAHGCRLQAIDLRWGVSEEAALDQQTMKICVGEIERCGAGAAHAVGAVHEAAERGQIGLYQLLVAEREAGREQRLIQAAAAADAQSPVVHLRARAAGRGEEFVADRVVDDRLLRFAAHREGD